MRTVASIKLKISENLGGHLEFDNGCSIDLTPKEGYFFGTNPYGVDWICNHNDNFISVIAEWVIYWDMPRTETGELITNYGKIS